MAGIQPSPAQAQNIREKTEAVFRLFRPVHPVVAVSARTGREPDTLVSALMTALPDHAASPLMTRLQDELRTESVRSQAREQFTGAVDRMFDTAESVCVASVLPLWLVRFCVLFVTPWSLLPARYGTGFSSEPGGDAPDSCYRFLTP